MPSIGLAKLEKKNQKNMEKKKKNADIKPYLPCKCNLPKQSEYLSL